MLKSTQGRKQQMPEVVAVISRWCSGVRDSYVGEHFSRYRDLYFRSLEASHYSHIHA
jgi:hypothetical protein